MIGLASIAAVAAMAFIGASSASATTLCLKNLLPCLTGAEERKTEVNGVSTDSKFTGGLFTQTCKNNKMHAEVTNTAGEGAANVAATLTFNTECSPCKKVTASVESASLQWTPETMNGVVTGTGHAVFSECSFGAECQFGGTGVKLTVEGNETNAKVLANVKLKLEKGSAFVCGSEGVWTATFTGETEKDKMTLVST
ncbi:MAG TPA: hypothetical protein VF245_08905 [Solirubrobacterales bacterium]